MKKINFPNKLNFDFKKLGKHDLIYIGWTAAIFLCVALSVFAFMFASCSKGGAEPDNIPESPAMVSPVL